MNTFYYDMFITSASSYDITANKHAINKQTKKTNLLFIFKSIETGNDLWSVNMFNETFHKSILISKKNKPIYFFVVETDAKWSISANN